MEENIKKPEILYRGITFRGGYSIFDFDNNAPLWVHYEPKMVDGHHAVSDGNEYGLYMTDNSAMVSSAYGEPDSDKGEMVKDRFLVFGQHILKYPSCALIYEIRTENYNIRNPHLYYFKGVSGRGNNSFEGRE